MSVFASFAVLIIGWSIICCQTKDISCSCGSFSASAHTTSFVCTQDPLELWALLRLLSMGSTVLGQFYRANTWWKQLILHGAWLGLRLGLTSLSAGVRRQYHQALQWSVSVCLEYLHHAAGLTVVKTDLWIGTNLSSCCFLCISAAWCAPSSDSTISDFYLELCMWGSFAV